ncbi:hypothetical protein CHLRE_14g633450v5 [Chlamydomonas reinhardtii]|uniref:Uncharacterized protein n=1 Tax=Chlamydomonas reinhardtii TaxID=3055 RepID=A0A2K3CYX9_CHLRE|nr:uncharacterized protein CHLRE_14g633450v5 [Chlamydomonas reinhardtii]PNW73481.1 hypothetical protein CHLRE_14g633450v5 [Chlamydomonas reinhardtii]
MRGRAYLLFRLSSRFPPVPRLAGDPSKRHAALDDLFTLPGLDKETTTPYGDTAVHIVVKRCLKGSYFPDKQEVHNGQVLVAGRRCRDACRADYLSAALPALLQAGFDPNTPDAKGRTVAELLRVGLRDGRYSEDCWELLREAGREEEAEGLERLHAAMQHCLQLCHRLRRPPPPAAAHHHHLAGAAAAAAAHHVAGSTKHPQQQVPDSPPKQTAAAAMAGGSRPAAAVPDAPRKRARSEEPQVQMTFGRHAGKPLADMCVRDVRTLCEQAGMFDDQPQLRQHMLDLGLIQRTATAAAAAEFPSGYQPVWRVAPASPGEAQAAAVAVVSFGGKYAGQLLKDLPRLDRSYLDNFMCNPDKFSWAGRDKQELLRHLEVLELVRYSRSGQVEPVGPQGRSCCWWAHGFVECPQDYEYPEDFECEFPDTF